MIQINLLPEDLRKVEHTPYPRLLVILSGVILFCSLSFYALHIYWIRIPNMEEKLESEKKRLADIKAFNKQITKLEKELEAMRQRRDIVMRLVLDRVRWAKKLDQFCDVVERMDNVWFTSMSAIKQEVSTGRRGPVKVIYKISLQGTAIIEKDEDEFSVIAEIQRTIKTPPPGFVGEYFYDQIEKIDIPSWSITDLPDLNMRQVTFPLTMIMDPKLNRRLAQKNNKEKTCIKEKKKIKKT